MKTVNIPVQNNADAAIIIEFLDEFFWPNIAKGCQKFLKTSMTKEQWIFSKRSFFCNLLLGARNEYGIIKQTIANVIPYSRKLTRHKINANFENSTEFYAPY